MLTRHESMRRLTFIALGLSFWIGACNWKKSLWCWWTHIPCWMGMATVSRRWAYSWCLGWGGEGTLLLRWNVLCLRTWNHLYRYSAFYQAVHERGYEGFAPMQPTARLWREEECCNFDIHCLMLFQSNATRKTSVRSTCCTRAFSLLLS
jgi:hypothetical protein